MRICCASAQAELALESVVGRVLVAWSTNLGAIFYTRGDRKSGAVRLPRWCPAACAPAADAEASHNVVCVRRRPPQTVRSKIAGHPGAVLVFPEGTTQAYGPPMADKMRSGAIEAAFESSKLVQPVRAAHHAATPTSPLVRARFAVARVSLRTRLRWRDGL
jgi:hypothetical protein